MSVVASPSRPPPPLPSLPACHTCTCCGSASRAPLNVCVDSDCGGGRRCGGLPRPAEAAGCWLDAARGRSGGPGRATSRSGLRVFFLSFLFSLCLLQDLKGQPWPRRGARRPPFLWSPDALCGPAGPAGTGAQAPNRRVFLGSHPARGSGEVEGARLFLQSPIGRGTKTTQQLLFHAKVGSKEEGGEVSQTLSEFQRAQKDPSPPRETTGLRHSRAPQVLRATPP